MIHHCGDATPPSPPYRCEQRARLRGPCLPEYNNFQQCFGNIQTFDPVKKKKIPNILHKLDVHASRQCVGGWKHKPNFTPKHTEKIYEHYTDQRKQGPGWKNLIMNFIIGKENHEDDTSGLTEEILYFDTPFFLLWTSFIFDFECSLMSRINWSNVEFHKIKD